MSTLVGPEDQPHLSQLLNKPTTVKQLIKSLKKVGYYFFPEPDASKFASTTNKRSSVELASYRGMAMASSGISFRWSRWNSEAATGKVVMGVADTCEEGEQVRIGRMSATATTKTILTNAMYISVVDQAP